jgi:hypothetical protein
MEPTCKTCTHCGETLPLSEFHADGKNKDGLSCQCKECIRKKAAARRARDKQDRPRVTFVKGSLNTLIERAKAKGLAFDLDEQWVEEKLDAGVCEATGQPLDLSFAFARAPRCPSFHRRDSKGGYTKANTRVVWLCMNQFVGQMKPDEAFAVWRQANDGFLSQGFAICNHPEALAEQLSQTSPPSIAHAPSAGGQKAMDDDEWRSTILSVAQAGSMTDETSSRSAPTVTRSSIRARR